MIVHQNSDPFQVLRGQAVHFLSCRNRSEFAPESRLAMTRAFDSGALIVGTNGHQRYHLPAGISAEEIKKIQRDWSYGPGHGIWRCSEKGVRFIRACGHNMTEAGGKYSNPAAMVLVAAGKPALTNVPHHGTCPRSHYVYDPELDVLTALTYSPKIVKPVYPGLELAACRSAMEATEPGTVTDDQRRVLRLGDRGVSLYTTGGAVVVQGLTHEERLLVAAHSDLCHHLLTSLPGVLSDEWNRLSSHRSSSVVGFASGENETQRFYFEHDSTQLLRWESQRTNRVLCFPDVGDQ